MTSDAVKPKQTPGTHPYLVISFVRRGSFSTGDADAQAACLSDDGQGVLQVEEGQLAILGVESQQNPH